MNIIDFFKRIRYKKNDYHEEIKKNINEAETYFDNENYENTELDIKFEEKEIVEEVNGEIFEEVIELSKEEIDSLIYNEILNIIDVYDDFEKVNILAKEAAKNIGKENLIEITKFLNIKFNKEEKYIDKYNDDNYWDTVVENSILMIIYNYKEEAVDILKEISKKNFNLNLKAINLLCRLASEGVDTEETINWIMNNLIDFNDENKIRVLGFMSQIKNNNQVIALIQHFYKSFAKNGEFEFAYKTLNHLINAAERFTNGHLKFLKEVAINKGIINLEEIMTLEEGDIKLIDSSKIDDKLSIDATIMYYSLNKNDDEINSKIHYLSEYSLDEKLKERIKNLINE